MKLQDFSIDQKTWKATIGGGTKLSDVTKKLHNKGKRAISHGTCPGVGIGGHATIVSMLYLTVTGTITKDAVGRAGSFVTHVGILSRPRFGS